MTTQSSRSAQREILPDTGLVALVPIETVDELEEGGIIARVICRGPLSEDGVHVAAGAVGKSCNLYRALP